MSEPMKTTQDLLAAIIAERGGEQAFSAVQHRFAYGLAAALRDPSAIDPSLAAKLADQLPPIVGVRPGAVIDIGALDDEGLDQLEALLERAPRCAPADASDQERRIAELTAECARLSAEREQMDVVVATYARAEGMHKRLAGDLRAEVDRLKDQLGKIAAASVATTGSGGLEAGADANRDSGPPQGQGGPLPDRPSNVVDIRGNGSAAISAPLQERYPFLGDLPPVAR